MSPSDTVGDSVVVLVTGIGLVVEILSLMYSFNALLDTKVFVMRSPDIIMIAFAKRHWFL